MVPIKCSNDRQSVLLEFLKYFMAEFGDEFSACICGSSVIGAPNIMSDIDFLIAIEPKKFLDAVNTSIFKNIFKLQPTKIVSDQFETGYLHSFRPPDSEFLGIILSVNIVSHHLFPKLSQLEDFAIRKFRFAAPVSNMAFRGFGNAYGQNPININLVINKIDGGFITETRSMIWHNNEPFFHIYADKFTTCSILHDYFLLGISQINMRIRVFEEFLRTDHVDPFGFLHSRLKASETQLSRLANGIPNHLCSAALPENQGYDNTYYLKIAEIAKLAHKIIIISGSSGIGKDSVVDALVCTMKNTYYFIPSTTRTPREKESGLRYMFVSQDEFKSRRESGDLLYWQYNGLSIEGPAEYYYIPFSDIVSNLNMCDKLLFTVGGVGFSDFMKRLFHKCTTIGLWPENNCQLENQLRKRGTEKLEDIERRLLLSKLTETNNRHFDHNIVNFSNNLNQTINDIKTKITN